MLTILKRVDPARYINRWYMVAVVPGLFSQVILLRAWGNRRNSYQRVRV